MASPPVPGDHPSCDPAAPKVSGDKMLSRPCPAQGPQIINPWFHGSTPGSVGQSQPLSHCHSHPLWGQSHMYLLALLPRPSRWPLCPLVPWLPRAPSDAWCSTGSCLSLDRMKMTRMILGCLFQLSLALPSIVSHTGKNPLFNETPLPSPGMRVLGGFSNTSHGFRHLCDPAGVG